MTVPETKTLGPHTRYALWVQGCKRRCEGCISSDAQALDGGYEVPISKIRDEIVNARTIEGITISGGEPFLQSEALSEMIQEIRAVKDIGVIVYTGYLYEEIKNNPLANMADIIIDGEYKDELNDGLSLRGSSNQNVILVTDRYRELIPLYYGVAGRKIELHITDGQVRMVGVPDKRTLDKLQGGIGSE